MDNKYILTSDGELYHYGVKGQKWGVRKKDLKRAIRKAQVDKSRADSFKAHGTTEDEYRGPGKKGGLLYKMATSSLGDIYEDSSTGKAYDNVVKKMKGDADSVKTIKKYIDEVRRAEKQLDDYDHTHRHTDNYDYRKVDAMSDRIDKAQYKVDKAVTNFAKKYKNDFDDARLRDSGYATITRGREMLRSYNMDVPLSEIKKLVYNSFD